MVRKRTSRSTTLSGFVLIECLCYLAIICVLMGVMFPCVVSMHKNVVQALAMQALILDTHAALDFIARDISHTDNAKKAWKRTEDELILHIGNQDIGWVKQQNNLVRISGMYKTADRSWTIREKSLVLEHVKQVAYQAHEKDGFIACVDIDIQVEQAHKPYAAHLAVCPRTAKVLI